ncbi:C6 zinc finger domain containing protein [Colletotrichum asianum]
MTDDTAETLRTTQRAPRSCRSCASRKVKCDKASPCLRCIRRGDADKCVRETVIVRGEVTRGKDPTDAPTYEDLVRENERLRSALSIRTSVHHTPNSPLLKPRKPQRLLECHDVLEEMVFDPRQRPKSSGRMSSWDEITSCCPDRGASEQLIAYDKTWNSWVHYALEYPTFQEEHSKFMGALKNGALLSDCDPAWLSLYFSVITAALLMMDDEEACLILPGKNHKRFLQDWYESALFCMYRADFMRTTQIHIVQAVAVLGMCFYNFGDSELSRHLWSCAIRTAQTLGLDGSRGDDVPTEMSQEAQHRLWWTLVICEWLAVPYHVPQVDEGDFNVPLPSRDPEHDIPGGIQPVQYHIFMARTSIVYHRFRSALREGSRLIAEVVRLADDELAEVINTLPEHLQPDGGKHERMQNLEIEHPWIKWQRFDISLVLLHHRMRINRALQKEWMTSPGQYEWARTVCIRSAMDIIWITHNWDQPAAMRRQWALSLHIFVAAIFLLRESRKASPDPEVDFSDEVQLAIRYLDEVKSRNAIADRASDILRDFIKHMDDPML